MNKIVASELPKTVSELTHILRWEDDGGAAFKTDIPLPKVAGINTPRSMDAAREGLNIGNTIKGELK